MFVAKDVKITSGPEWPPGQTSGTRRFLSGRRRAFPTINPDRGFTARVASGPGGHEHNRSELMLIAPWRKNLASRSGSASGLGIVDLAGCPLGFARALSVTL